MLFDTRANKIIGISEGDNLRNQDGFVGHVVSAQYGRIIGGYGWHVGIMMESGPKAGNVVSVEWARYGRFWTKVENV